HRRSLRRRGRVGDPPGGLVPSDGPPDLPDGAAPPPLRADRLARGKGRDPLLDPGAPGGAPRAHDPQAAVRAKTPARPSSTLLQAPRGRDWRNALAGRSVTVVGLARSGVAACRLLLALGARVIGTDARAPAALTPDARALETDGVRLVVEGHPPEAFR